MMRLRAVRYAAIIAAVALALLLLLLKTHKTDVNPFREQSAVPVLGWEDLSTRMKARAQNCPPDRLSLMQAKNMSSEVVSPCRRSLQFRRANGTATALASFPGSGNTWLRFLLEQATGVLTGSIYCDKGLKPFFSGEYVTSSSVLAVKTHSASASSAVQSSGPGPVVRGRVAFSRAVVMVRNPVDALLSEAHRFFGRRQQNKHLRTVQKHNFFDSVEWYDYVKKSAYRWASMYTYWLHPSLDIPVIVVKYEDLQNNLESELKRVLDFLNQRYTDEELKCVLENKSGHFQRSKHLEASPFSPELIDLIRSYINQTAPILSIHNIHY